MTYRISTLKNGIRVASERLGDSLSSAFAIAVDVGARHERPQEAGLSHLLEHMAFKGTSRMNARKIAETFDLMGGNVNAYTSHEHTIYYAKVLKDYADEALKLLCDIVSDSVFEQAELERERHVVLQELAMHADTPDDLVFDLFQETVFRDQPLGRSILGTTHSVSGFSREDLLRYTRDHYQPKHLVVAGAGAVEHDSVARTVEEFFGGRDNAHAVPPAAAATYTGGEKLVEKSLEQVQLVLGFPGLPVTSDEYYALQVLTTVLGGGMSSRLFQEVREARGLAYSVLSSFAAGYQDVGILGIYAGTSESRTPELMDAIRSVLADIKSGISAAELLRAKNQLKGGVVMTRESSSALAEWIARHLHVFGRYRPAEELIAKIDEVHAEDVVRVAAQCLGSATPTVVALGPGVTKASLAERLVA
ncbi:MAG: pitrilysin family protein [Alphaproteobacteria bacterium]